MKRTFFTFFFLLAMANVYAYDIAVENANGVTIYYNYINDGQELEVTYKTDNLEDNAYIYAGRVVIPEEVTYMNRTRKVTRIGPWTFYNCKGLTSVTIPNSVTSIGNEAFYKCISLTSITIPSSVTSIGEALCYYCTNLTSVNIPNSLTSISKNAFSQCYSLTSVTIPESVKSIGAASFAGCASLTSITIPFGVTSILIETFSGCSGLISVKIPNSVTSIGDYAFRRCTSLNSIIIPNSVTSIGVNAFENCGGLKSITIPNSVTVIKENAFEGCDLDAVISMIEDPFTIRGKDGMYRAFSVETFNNAVLSVPANAIEKYKATEGWQDFANILTLDSIKHPFVEAGKRWCVHGFNMGSAHRVIDYYFTNEEETINGKTYLPMYEKEGEQTTLVGLFREEDHRVYLYNKDAGREFLTYDFSLQEGDSFEPEYGDFSHGKVTKVSYKDVNGEKLKVISFEANDGHYLGGNDRVEMEWIEGIGYPSRPLGGLFSKNMDPSWYYYTAYVLYDNTREPNYYLPFSFHLPYDGWWGQQSQSTRIATGAEPGLHYELLPDPARDGYLFHVYGVTFWSNSPNRYVYLIDEKSDGLTHKLKFQFEELEPCVDGVGWYHIDMSFPFFLPENKYVVVDEQGEHPVPVLDDYRPFIEEGKEWEVAHPGILGTDFGNKALMKYCFYFDGDMMVNGRLCKKMMCRKEYSIYASGEPTTTTYVGALYEENRRVYYAPPESSDFVLLYDFGSSVGSEISYYSTETKEMYKGYIKNRKISNDEKFHGRTTFIPYYVREYDIFLNDDRYDYLWREGVGYKGFINSFDFDQSPYTELMSCTVGDEVLYYDSYFVFYPQSTPDPSEVKKNTIDFTHVVKTRPKAPRRGESTEMTDDTEETESLTGEYSMKELFVNFKPLAGPYVITICNESGTEIYRKEVQTSNVVGLNTDISGYEKGEYTITVENDEEAYTAEFKIDEETGIKRPTPDPSRDGGEKAGAVYDLSGRKLNTPSPEEGRSGLSRTLPKGIYIRDGRKVVVR